MICRASWRRPSSSPSGRIHHQETQRMKLFGASRPTPCGFHLRGTGVSPFPLPKPKTSADFAACRVIFSACCFSHSWNSSSRSGESGGRERAAAAGSISGRPLPPWIVAYKDTQGKGGEKKRSEAARTKHSSWEYSAEKYFSRNGGGGGGGRSPLMTTEEEETTATYNGGSSTDKDNNKTSDYGIEEYRGEESTTTIERTVQQSEKERHRRSSWEGSGESYSSSSRSGSDKLPRGNNRRRSRDAGVDNNCEYRTYHVEDGRGQEEAGEVEDEDAEPVDDPRWDRIKSNYRGFINRDRVSRFEKPEVRRWNKQDDWGRKTWKEETESSVPKIVGQGVYGVGPVLAALTEERREFYALYVQEGLDLSGNNRKKKDKKGVEKVLKLAENMGLKVIDASKHDLNMVVDNRPHQGLVLDASPLEMVNIRELDPPVSTKGHKAPLWVALDEVTDPQNLGAIIRSAYFFGVEGVVLCAKNSAPLSGVVSKASAGSLELIELRSCKNMMQFLSLSIQNGWRVLGGSVSSRALPLSVVDAGMSTILVLGSEGSGLRPLVERSCTQLIRIPGNMSIHERPEGTELEPEPEEMDQSQPGQELKSFLAVESLNVSVAAGVLLYHLVGSDTRLADT